MEDKLDLFSDIKEITVSLSHIKHTIFLRTRKYLMFSDRIKPRPICDQQAFSHVSNYVRGWMSRESEESLKRHKSLDSMYLDISNRLVSDIINKYPDLFKKPSVLQDIIGYRSGLEACESSIFLSTRGFSLVSLEGTWLAGNPL